MFFARKPFVRSTTLLAACAASFILLSSGSAQQRDLDLGCGSMPYRQMFTERGARYLGADIEGR